MICSKSFHPLKLFFKSKIKRDLENDKIFEKGIEIHNYAQTMLESMDKYFKNIFDFHKSLKYEQTRNLLEASKLFLNSDLPESTLKVLGDSYLAETDFLDFYDGRIRKEKLSLIACRGNRLKFEKTCAAHNKWVHNFDVKVDQIERERVKLFWYVDISNSSNVKEIFQDKFISIQRLEKKFLNELIIKLEKTISELQELVFAGIGVSCFPSTKLDAGVKTMASLMNILSQ